MRRRIFKRSHQPLQTALCEMREPPALTNANGDEQLVSLSDTIVEAGLKGEQSRRNLN